MASNMFALVFYFSSIIAIGISCQALARTPFNNQEVLNIKVEPTLSLQNPAENDTNRPTKERVPILRTFGVSKFPSKVSNAEDTLCNTGIRTKESSTRYFSASGSACVYKSRAIGNQWSATRIKLYNGPDSIEAGMMVKPSYYKDSEAHLYARFNAGPSGCYNVDCPGFVQVSKDVTLGMIPDAYSQFGNDSQKFWNMSIDKHQDDGHWWLSLSINKDKKAIGYWPKTLFSSLSQVASQVEWGGEIGNPDNENTLPDMGSGLRPRYDTSKSSYFFQVSESPQNTESYDQCEDYTTLDVGDRGGYWGHLVFYGGPYTDIWK